MLFICYMYTYTQYINFIASCVIETVGRLLPFLRNRQ